jgi:hypothetical protein
MKKLLCILALAVVGCGREWTAASPGEQGARALLVCLNMPTEEAEPAAQAVEVWNHALGGWRGLTPSVGGRSDCDVTVDVVDTKETWCGHTSELGGNHVVLNSTCLKDTYAIVMHELGHVFGAQHAPNTLMAPTLSGMYSWAGSGTLCPDKTTIAQVAAYQRISLTTLSWCY